MISWHTFYCFALYTAQDPLGLPNSLGSLQFVLFLRFSIDLLTFACNELAQRQLLHLCISKAITDALVSFFKLITKWILPSRSR